ncbi:MAG: hypothetical protein ACYCW6_15490 [Candidatus Xenobia bacterium]
MLERTSFASEAERGFEDFFARILRRVEAVMPPDVTALSVSMAMLVDLLAPQAIVLGNVARRLGEPFVQAAVAAMREEALPLLAEQCSARVTGLGEKIGDVASLCAAIYHGGEHHGAGSKN